MPPSLTIVLPTYNEAKNIHPLLASVTAALQHSSVEEYQILFVDDSSDETPTIIKQYMEKDSRIDLIHRPKEERTGLATAFVAGFTAAKGVYVCCLDSDLQHPPEVIPSLLTSLIKEKADIAVASRYISGGNADGLGSFFRKVISKLTKYVCQIILSPARCTSDPGSGFFLFKKKVIKGTTLSPRGFKILLEILVKGTHKKVIDIPYSFRLRENDESKATLRQGITMLGHILTLFWTVPAAGRFWRFIIVGGIGTLINLLILYIAKSVLSLPIYLSWFLSVVISIAANFTLNNRFTFPEHRASSRAQYIEKYLSYTTLSFLTLGINYLFFSTALSLGAHYLLAAVCGIIGAFVVNFLVSKNIIWSPKALTRPVPLNTPRSMARYLLRAAVWFFVTYFLLQLFIGLSPVVGIITAVSLILTVQGLFSLYTMIYAWENPEHTETFRSPTTFETTQQLSFTALVPARHEKDVIGETIQAINAIDYPLELKEILVICRSDDKETIRAASRTIRSIDNEHVRLITFDGFPINKPHALNIALAHATGDIITVFDAEDEPHRDIYNIINTVYHTSDADVVQSGVQLMDHTSHWYSLYNVLEYFFWFKSSLHFFSKLGMTPLGGNTVFFKHGWIKSVGGWDENCLTEDGDVGVRLSIAGAKVRIVYEEAHVTREETPPTLASFIKQRTRWNQGFIQILLKGEWKKLPTVRQKALALYILSWPIAQGILFIYTPIALWLAFTSKMPPLAAIIANLPLYVLILFLVVYNIGLWEFSKNYKKPYRWYFPIISLLFFYPFQFILGLSAFRAVYRTVRGYRSWEKTKHTNAHREKAVITPELL